MTQAGSSQLWGSHYLIWCRKRPLFLRPDRDLQVIQQTEAAPSAQGHWGSRVVCMLWIFHSSNKISSSMNKVFAIPLNTSQIPWVALVSLITTYLICAYSYFRCFAYSVLHHGPFSRECIAALMRVPSSGATTVAAKFSIAVIRPWALRWTAAASTGEGQTHPSFSLIPSSNFNWKPRFVALRAMCMQ